MDITVCIRKLVQSYGLDPFCINNGLCSEFADHIEEKVPGAEAEEAHPDSEFFGHVWIVYNERYFDAEAPEGVKRLGDLPIFKRWFPKLDHDPENSKYGPDREVIDNVEAAIEADPLKNNEGEENNGLLG